MFDAVYLNVLDNFKQWYTPYENENQEETIFTLNTIILTKVTVKSINDVALPARASNNLISDAFCLGYVYVCDDTHNEIIKTIFARGELIHDAFILEG